MLDRALAFTWAIGDAAAEEVVRVPGGAILRSPSRPAAWSVNCLRVEGAQPGLTLTDADALCAAHLGHVAYRHVYVQEERTADRLAAAARAEGWEVETEVVMLLGPAAGEAAPARPSAGAGPAPSPPGAVREGTLDEILDLLDAWNREDGSIKSDADAADLRAMARGEHTAMPERRLVVEDPPGRPAAMTTLRWRDGVCQIEDVFALADARGRGHGRALMTRAVAEARAGGHELVFIAADDDGWPKHLYASVGFVPAGRRATLHRKL